MNEEFLRIIRANCNNFASVLVTDHARKRIKQRGISLLDVLNVMRSGEIIEDYPDDFPYPSCLMLGQTLGGEPLHICIGWGDNILRLITLYIPTLDEWESDYKTRKAAKL